MNVPSVVALTVLIAVVSFAPRRWALLGMMASVLYLTQGMVIEIFGIHMYAIRILVLAGAFRIIRKKELPPFITNKIDGIFLWVCLYALAISMLRSALGQATSAEVSQSSQLSAIGSTIDVILCYFVFRGLIDGYDDFIWGLRSFVIVLVPYVSLATVERLTGHNPLSILNGVPEVWIDGNRLRCFGSFMHPSLFGTLGASFFPIYFGVIFTNKKNRTHGLLGMALSLAIIFIANSGGPVSCVAVGMAGWLLWFMRVKMFIVRRVIFGLLVGLALVMKAPLWYLPHKLSAITGGDGWHRSRLMELTFENFDQWWLAGMPLDLTKDWFPYQVGGAVDITNLYIAFGLNSGFPAMIFFIVLIIRAYSALGRSLAGLRSNSRRVSEAEFIFWGLGCTLSGHVSNWLAITYWDQINVVWLMQLSVIATLTQTDAILYKAPVSAKSLQTIRLRQSIYVNKNLAAQ